MLPQGRIYSAMSVDEVRLVRTVAAVVWYVVRRPWWSQCLLLNRPCYPDITTTPSLLAGTGGTRPSSLPDRCRSSTACLARAPFYPATSTVWTTTVCCCRRRRSAPRTSTTTTTPTAWTACWRPAATGPRRPCRHPATTAAARVGWANTPPTVTENVIWLS